MFLYVPRPIWWLRLLSVSGKYQITTLSEHHTEFKTLFILVFIFILHKPTRL
jgi:hypothetical protein